VIREPHEICHVIEPLAPTQSAMASEIYLQYAEMVGLRLQVEFHWVHEDEIAEAVVEAVLSAAHDSSDFDPARGGFAAYLQLLARNDLRTRLRGEKRLKAREAKKAEMTVTFEEPAAPLLQENDPAETAVVKELQETLARTETERVALGLWMKGIDSAVTIAECLGFGTDAAAVRRAATLQARLRQRIHRERTRRQSHDAEDS